MKVSSLWIALAGLSLAFPATAEKPKAEIPVIGETIDVRVVNVEAVVTNPSGQRVPGLSTADFRLLVDGREVPIEYFAEITEGKSVQADKAPVAAGETVGRNYLVYLDDSFSLANRRNDVLDKLERDLALLGPADRMALIAFDGARLSVLCPWTGDAKTLHDALAKARQRPSARRRDARPPAQAPARRRLDHRQRRQYRHRRLRPGWRPQGQRVRRDLRGFLQADQRRGPDPARQVHRCRQGGPSRFRGAARPQGHAAPFRRLVALRGGPPLRPVVQAANQLGYTVYPVDASQSDATENTGLDALARATGGRLLIPANNASSAKPSQTRNLLLARLYASLEGGRSRARRHPGGPQAGLVVRTKSGFSDLSHQTEAAMKAESVLLFGGAGDDRKLIVQLGEPKRDGSAFEVPVTLGVPVEALALTPKGKGYQAVVPLAVSTEEEDGRRANLAGPRLEVKMSALPQAGTYARFQTVVRLRDPKQRLIFSVHDPVSGHALWGQAKLGPGK